ncbi:AAA domain-containing protein [Lentzea albidocapillata subsp. violacea]|uniref:AAA domain-containing protein n=1 Tax=Lentzea albidocapillata subsp. violacea TaxID=128104 RepID=A0A1G9ATQ0_9PSEU|nr:AAA family ATPase [Lentzea albidocapillata]SDK30716.1 AAA domain-containing protein [Lentzea albidocapillata subsp. violacea]
MSPRVVLIAGPPCSGKTTLALQLAQADDLLVDRDAIARQLGSPRNHMHSRYVTRLAELRMRALLARLQAGDFTGTAYVVRCLPRQAQRNALARRLGAEVRLLDPGLAECLRRATVDGRPRGTTEAIRQWYARSDPHGQADAQASLGTSRSW